MINKSGFCSRIVRERERERERERGRLQTKSRVSARDYENELPCNCTSCINNAMISRRL